MLVLYRYEITISIYNSITRMKYIYFIICLLGISFGSFAQSPLETQVDFAVENMPLPKALIQLGQTAGVPISFSDNILPKKKKISLQVSNQKVKTILAQMLIDTDVQFRAIGVQIVLFYKKRPSQSFTISGFIDDLETGEKLLFANIFDKKSGRGTSANEYGFFNLTLEEGKVELVISYTGYNHRTQHINLRKDRKLNFSLKPNLTLQEIIVTPFLTDDMSTTEPLSSDDIPILHMKKFSTIGGEADLFRIVESQPGVQSGADGIGGLHVRGGSADQNLILMDGVPIYNPAHSLGIFSVFNSEAIQSAQLYKGAFPARYGGRLSSVLDVHTREGNKKKWSGSAKASLIASTARIEGPIIKDKASILITARRTFLDEFIKKETAKAKSKDEYFTDLYGVPLEGFSKYSFYDLNAKLNFNISEKDKFFFSYYTGGDMFQDEDYINDSPQDGYLYSDAEIQHYNWGNQIGVFRWNHVFRNNLFLNTTLTHSIYQFDVEQSFEFEIIPDATIPPTNVFLGQAYFSTLKDWGARLDFDYTTSKNHNLKFGINSTRHTFQPGAFGADGKIDDESIYDVDIDSFLNATRISVYEHNAYIENEFSVGKKLNFNLGVLGNAFVGEDKTYFIIQPRFSANYQIIKQLSIQVGVSKMAQPLHLVTGSDAGFPNDLWMPSTKLIRPQISWQGVLGIQYRTKKPYQFSLEGYYKKIDNLVRLLDNTSLRIDASNPSGFSLQSLGTNNWETQVTLGEGWQYGLEFQAQKKLGKTTGWVNYNWAFANRRFDEYNSGNIFPYRYDRRHNFNISINHQFAKWLDFSCNWVYGTGLSVFIPIETILSFDGEVDIKYGFDRMPPNHRLDAGFNFYFNSWKLKHQIYLGAYNIYNRENPQYYQLKSEIIEGSDPNNPQIDYKIFQGSVLPFLPSISYSISF